MSKITKTVLLFLCTSVFALILCSCSRETANNMGRDVKNAGRGIRNAGREVADMFEGNTATNGQNYAERSDRNSTVTGGDTVGNAVSGIMGSTAVGERNGMTGTSTRGTNNPAARGYRTGTNQGQINTTNGSADGGNGDMYSDTSMSSNSFYGINSRHAGGSGNPNYTK